MISSKTSKLIAGSILCFGVLGNANSPLAQEVLPWANQPVAAASDPAAPPAEISEAQQAAEAQCAPLFEAACRDLKTCAWIGDVTLSDGTLSPARCLARPPAPPKKAASKKPAPAKAKDAAASNDAATALPVGTATVTPVIETEVAPKKPAPVKKVAKPEAEPDWPQSVEVPSKGSKPQADANAEPAKAPEPQKPKQAAAPIVVTPPAATAKAEDKAPAKKQADAKAEEKKPAGPSFGSFSSMMPGSGDAVVVTVPPSN